LEISVSAAITSTNSDLFTLKFLSLLRCPDFSTGMSRIRKPYLRFQPIGPGRNRLGLKKIDVLFNTRKRAMPAAFLRIDLPKDTDSKRCSPRKSKQKRFLPFI
jgi:hypothetical protein